MMSRKSEMGLRALAMLLGLAWLAGMVVLVSSGGEMTSLARLLTGVCWIAAYVGGPIVAMLLSKRQGEGHGCAWALGAFFVPVFILPILALWKIRFVTSPNISRLRRDGDLPRLIKALHYRRIAYTRSNAAKALAEIGGAKVVELLITTLGDTDRLARAAAADALGQVGGRPEDAVLRARAVEPLIAALKDEDPDVRSGAARALGQTGDERVEPLLIVALKDRDAFMRRTAAQALAKVGGEKAVEPLIHSLDDQASEVRRHAAVALGKICARLEDTSLRTPAVASLVNRLKDGNAGVRKYAAEMLGVIGDRRAVKSLVALLGDADRGVRSGDADRGVRSGAALALGQIGDRRALAALTSTLQDNDEHVRNVAASSLDQIRQQPVTEVSYSQADDTGKEIGEAAAEALHILDANGANGAKPADEAQRHLEQAYVYDDSNEFEKALRECEAAVQLAPDWAEAYNLRGVVLESLGRKEEALAVYREAVRLDPTFDEARENLQEAQAELGGRQPALTEYPSYAQAPPAAASQTSMLAIVSLVAGIVGWILPLFGATVAVIAGHLAKKDIRNSVGKLGGKGLAIAGLVLGYGQFALIALIAVVVVVSLLAGRAGGTAVRPTAAVPVIQVVATATIDAGQATVASQAMQTEAAAQAIHDTVMTSSRWPLVLLDTFDSNVHNWPTGSNPDELATVTRNFTDGKYRWDVEAHQGVHPAARLDAGAISDFYLTVEARKISGPDDSGYGVEFRVRDATSKYYFGTFGSRYFGFFLLHGGQWTTLIDLTPTSAILAGEVNRITIIAEGSHFAFFINDQFVAEADDDRLDGGTVGLAIELNEAGDKAVFEFDNLELRTPSSSVLQTPQPTPTPVLPLASPAPAGVRGGQIAFVSDRDGNNEIYVMEADGSNVRRLTDNSADDGGPAWSPDGSRIAFYSNRDDSYEIYVMEADGSNLRRLTSDTDSSVMDWLATWSPDGSQIAFSSIRDGNFEIYVMGADGSNVRRLTDNAAIDVSPTWSPDGTQIAFHSDRDGASIEIYVMGADGSNVRRLTNNDILDGNPAWRPGGTGADTGVLTPTPSATAMPPDGGTAQPTPTAPGEAIVLSENLQFEGIPQAVIPYGGGQSVSLADLRLTQNDDGITGEVHYTRNRPGEFTLVVYVTMPERLLVVYFDPTQRQILTTPKGSGGNALLSTQGYKLQGGADEGTIEFSFPSYTYGVYDITGTEGRVFAFCVQGKIDLYHVLPEDQQDPTTFQASSNVMAIDMDF